MVMEMIGLLFVEHFNHKSSSGQAYSVNFANGSQKRVSNIITNEIVYTFVKVKQEKKNNLSDNGTFTVVVDRLRAV